MFEILVWGGTAVGMLALGLLLIPVPQRAIARWLDDVASNEDQTFLAVREAGVRFSLIAGVVWLVLTVAGFMVQLKVVAPAVAVAFAIIVALTAPGGGGNSRRASLEPVAAPHRALLALRVGVAVGLAVLGFSAVASLSYIGPVASREFGTQGWGGILADQPVLPDYERYLLPVLAVASVGLLGLTRLAWRRTHTRQVLLTPDGDADAAFRRLSWSRIAASLLGGQLVLAGGVISTLPWYLSSMGSLSLGQLHVVAGVAMTVVVAGLVVIVLALLRPFWTATPRQPTPTPASG